MSSKSVQPPSGGIQGAPLTSLIAGSFLTGSMLSLSALGIPALLHTSTTPSSAPTLLQQWSYLYHLGHYIMPAIAVGTFSLYITSSLQTRSRVESNDPRTRNAGKTGNWKRWLYAGVVTMGMVPFTWWVMAPTNQRLAALEVATREGRVGEGVLRTARELAVRWAWLHVVRSAFPAVGVLVGLSARG